MKMMLRILPKAINMSAVATLKIRSQEFIKLLENCEKKCQEKKLSPNDLREFHQTILNSLSYSQREKHKVSKESETHLDQQVKINLTKLMKTLSTNKAILESAAATVPYHEMEKALNDVHEYVKQQDELKHKVAGKDKSTLPDATK
jgi:hypothetical protein